MATTPTKHSKRFKCSSSERWLNCPFSVTFPDTEPHEISESAEFGSQVHTLGAALIAKSLGVVNYDEENKTIDEVKLDLSMYSDEMQEIADGYADYAVSVYDFEKAHSKNEPLVMIEQQLDLDLEDDAVGTLDFGIISDRDSGTLTILDLKTGRTPVYAYNHKTGRLNSQISLYALYCYKTFKDLYHIEKVRLIIYQPVINNTNEYELTIDELLEFEEKVIKPAVKRINEGPLTPKVGDHCFHCNGKVRCRYKMLSDLWTLPFAEREVNILTDEEINAILPHVNSIIDYAESLKKYALKKALAGKKWKGFKLVNSRISRKIIDEEKVVEICEAEGISPYVDKKIAGITELTKRLGKERFKELLGGYIGVQEGSIVLVEESDAREEIDIEIKEEK